MQPLISAVTLKKEKASVALQEAVPRMLQAASLGLPCREMCDAITHTCGCDKPTTFGQVTCTPPLPTLAPFLFQVPQLFCVNNLQRWGLLYIWDSYASCIVLQKIMLLKFFTLFLSLYSLFHVRVFFLLFSFFVCSSLFLGLWVFLFSFRFCWSS